MEELDHYSDVHHVETYDKTATALQENLINAADQVGLVPVTRKGSEREAGSVPNTIKGSEREAGSVPNTIKGSEREAGSGADTAGLFRYLMVLS